MVHTVHRNMCIAWMYVVRSYYVCTYTLQSINVFTQYKYALILLFCMIVSKTWYNTQWHITLYTHVFSAPSFLSAMLCTHTYVTSPPIHPTSMEGTNLPTKQSGFVSDGIAMDGHPPVFLILSGLCSSNNCSATFVRNSINCTFLLLLGTLYNTNALYKHISIR